MSVENVVCERVALKGRPETLFASQNAQFARLVETLAQNDRLGKTGSKRQAQNGMLRTRYPFANSLPISSLIPLLSTLNTRFALQS